jgi:hypothetical protein
MFPGAAGLTSTQIGGVCGTFGSLCGATGTPSAQVTATQAMYDLFAYFGGNATSSLQYIDIPGQVSGWPAGNCYPSCATINGKVNPYSFYSPQFASLYAWRSIGNSAYNAGQFSLRRSMTRGLEFDLNYTYSKSMDMGSDAERVSSFEGLGFSGQILNAWNPGQFRAVSDFDATHQINANWIVELPFGKGRRFASESHGFVEALIGGWQLNGLARWTSGFPVGVGNGAQWPTNWELSGFATQTGPVRTRGVVKNPDGTVSLFGNADATTAAFNAFQADLPGQVGNRNILRGDGFAGLDLGLTKLWKMPWKESQTLQFRWEVFNALNLTRFDVQSLSLSLTNVSNFGNYTNLLTNPRAMQFALRYQF